MRSQFRAPLLLRLQQVKDVVPLGEEQNLLGGFFDFDVTANRQIDHGRGDVTGMNGVIEQSPGLGWRNAGRRFVHRRHGHTGLGIATLVAPEDPHAGERDQREKQDRICCQKPEKSCERARLFQEAFGNVDINGQPAAHGERVIALELGLAALGCGRRVPLRGTVHPREGLHAQRSGRGFRELNGRRGVINRYRPIIPRDVPIELVVIREEPSSVAHPVSDLDDLADIGRAGNVDLQVAILPRAGGIVLEVAALGIGDALNVDEQFIVRPVGPGIFNRNRAVDSVPLAHEDQGNALAHQRTAIFLDRDIVLKIGNPPGLGGCICH